MKNYILLAVAAISISGVSYSAMAFDPVGNANPQTAKDPEQAERMEQMMDVWNSMTPEERAASNAEKKRNEYQATTANNEAANKAKEARRKQAERNRAGQYNDGVQVAY